MLINIIRVINSFFSTSLIKNILEKTTNNSDNGIDGLEYTILLLQASSIIPLEKSKLINTGVNISANMVYKETLLINRHNNDNGHIVYYIL